MVTARSGLTYKKLSDRVFFWMALGMHALALTLALSISSVEAVFDFLGAIGSCSITFLFPGLAYLVALYKYGTNRHRQKWDTFFNQILAWVFLACFVAVFSLFLFFKIAQGVGYLPAEPSPTLEAVVATQ